MEYKSQELSSDKAYNPSEKVRETAQRVYQRFLDMQTERDKARREFGGRTLRQYVQDSLDLYNGVISDEVRASKEEWQSLTWDHVTRGKVKILIAMIIGMQPALSIIGKTKKANKYAKDLYDIYEDSLYQENAKYKLYLEALSAAIKGTVIVEEQYNEQKVTRKEIVKQDQETGEIEYRETAAIKTGVGRCESKIVPLLNFYPNENSAEIKHDCIVLDKLTKKQFLDKYGKYKDADKVHSGVYYNGVKTEYQTKTILDVDLIDVIRYYNEDFDEYIILANGVWINYQKGEKPACIPFNHKSLPFRKTVFELADEECFYGKSLPDIIQGEQDARNALERLMIDREILSLSRGFILGTGVELSSTALYPGVHINMTGGQPGVPIDQQVKEMSFSGANQSAFQMLQMLRSNADVNTSVDTIAHGVSGGGRKTARESVILDENSRRSSGPFLVHIYKLIRDLAELRIENIKQFYTQPLHYKPILDVKGNEIEGYEKPVYREIAIKEPGQDPRWLTIKPEIKGFDFHIRFVEDVEPSKSRSTRIEMARVVLDESKTNPLISADEATINWLLETGQDPEKFYLKPTQEAIDFQNQQSVPLPNQMEQIQ